MSMKIEDLKPGDRLWVEDRSGMSWETRHFKAVYLGDGMTKIIQNWKVVSLNENTWRLRTANFTLWEKIVDLFFKRN